MYKTNKTGEKVMLKWYDDTIKFVFLGPGYPMLFDFIKYCCLFLLVLILSTGSYNYFSSTIGNSCDLKNHCTLNFIIYGSYVNKMTGNFLIFIHLLDHELVYL